MAADHRAGIVKGRTFHKAPHAKRHTVKGRKEETVLKVTPGRFKHGVLKVNKDVK